MGVFLAPQLISPLFCKVREPCYMQRLQLGIFFIYFFIVQYQIIEVFVRGNWQVRVLFQVTAATNVTLHKVFCVVTNIMAS